MKADRRKTLCCPRKGTAQRSFFLSGFCFNSCDLALDFHHLFIVQRIEFHGNQRGDPTQHGDSEVQQDADPEQPGGQGIGNRRQCVLKAYQGDTQSYDAGCKGGNQLVHKTEHGSHHTGNKTAGPVRFVIGTVGDHRNDRRVRHLHGSVAQDVTDNENYSLKVKTLHDPRGHAEDEEQNQRNLEENGTPGEVHQCPLEADFSCNSGSKEDEQDGGQDGHGGNLSGDSVIPDDQCKYDQDYCGIAADVHTDLVGRGGDYQHLYGAVFFDDGPVILEFCLNAFITDTEEFFSVFLPDADDCQQGKAEGEANCCENQFVKQLQRKISVFGNEIRRKIDVKASH